LEDVAVAVAFTARISRSVGSERTGTPLLTGAAPRKAASFSLGVDQPRHLRGRSSRKASLRLICARPIPAKDDLLSIGNVYFPPMTLVAVDFNFGQSDSWRCFK
jgi:hypothetical protein